MTLSAVNDVEELTTGLARKIWQKIIILERLAPPAEPPDGRGGAPGATKSLG